MRCYPKIPNFGQQRLGKTKMQISLADFEISTRWMYQFVLEERSLDVRCFNWYILSTGGDLVF